MTDDPADASPAGTPFDVVVEALVEDVVAGYRIDRASARGLVSEVLGSDRALRTAAAAQGDLARLRRTRAFRDARKRTRRAVYYHLRRYKRGASLARLARRLAAASDDEAAGVVDELLAAHASTRERLASRRGFDRQLLDVLDRPRTVLDVGCGVYPLMFPFAEVELDLYLALDRDGEAVDAVRAFASVRPEPRLFVHRWHVADGWDGPAARVGAGAVFDVALMLKLVPVIARQEPEGLAVLARVPARRLVVSGSRRALVRRTDIERRERAVLRRFAERHGFVVVGELAVDEELALVLERPAGQPAR